MPIQTKQRWVGALVVAVIAIIFLPVLFYHPFPGMRNTAPAAPASTQVVYDLAVRDGKITTESVENATTDELLSSESLSDEDLRFRAAATTQISQRLLRTTEIPHEVHIKENSRSAIPPVKRTESLPLTMQDLPKAWVLQVGNFSREENATQLVEQLRALELDVYMRRPLNKKGSVQVFVGPYIVFHDLELVQKELQQKLRLNPVIREYRIS